jgi:uncharacterized damage-inducible protein DinB
MHTRTLLRGAHAFLPPPAVLAGLSNEHAARANGGAHSIAEIVAHMGFWQEWFLDRCDGIPAPLVERAALGWREVAEDEWPAVLERFEQGLARALRLADDDAKSALPLTPAIEFEPLGRYTVADALTHVALHNAHHTGQVITLRQQIGAWPPPEGSWTW